MSKTVEFFYDFSSPYTYLASKRIEGVCERNGAALEWRPFLLGGVFNEVGFVPAIEIHNKFEYIKTDTANCAKIYGIDFNFPELFPLHSVKGMRGAFAAAELNKIAEYSHRLFDLYWQEGKDINQDEVFIPALKELGIDTEWFLGRIAEQEIKDKLRQSTSEAVSRGVFGAPTFFVDDKMYWGNDRIDHLERYLGNNV